MIQVLGRPQAATAIAHVSACLRPGGRIHIAGSGIISDDRLSPVDSVFFNVTLMNLYPEGAAYTIAEHRTWLEAAGFEDVRFAPLPSGAPHIVARKRG